MPHQPHRSSALGFSLLVGLSLAGATAAGIRPARAQLSAGQAAGAWDLTFERGNRRCRLTLRAEGAGGSHALGMPAGCRHAFPTLMLATSWTMEPTGHLLLRSVSGQPVFDFAPTGGPSLSASVGEGGDTYLLTPSSADQQAALAAVPPSEAAVEPSPEPSGDAAPPVGADGGVLVSRGSAGATATAVEAPVVLPATTPAEVAGHYAVLRQNRDTGCMVTLEAGAASRGELRARLAPACRDQGIVIFDPTGWQIAGRGQELVLTARKGHTAMLTRRRDQAWSTGVKKGAVPLVLKRL